jgi:predicted nucleotidyltransferase
MVDTRVRELASDLQTSDRTLRRALEQGLIRGHRPSPRSTDVPLAERAYLRRAWPLLARMREALRTEPSVSLAVLFGSRARGDDHPDSDVDLLIGLRGAAESREVASRLSRRLGLRVQIVTLADADGVPLLLAEVLGEGRVLIDRDGEWPQLLRRRSRIDRAAERERHRIEREFAATFDRSPAA